MSDEHEDQLEWRDTYFVLFKQTDRPTVNQVEAAITESSKRLKLENLESFFPAATVVEVVFP